MRAEFFRSPAPPRSCSLRGTPSGIAPCVSPSATASSRATRSSCSIRTRRSGEPRIVARAATADSERALAATGAKTALTGHGEPWNAGAERAAEEARRAGVS
jgi:hypothetical protein